MTCTQLPAAAVQSIPSCTSWHPLHYLSDRNADETEDRMQIRPLRIQPEYSISDTGVLYGKNGRPMHPRKNRHGYYYTVIMMEDRKTKKTIFLHRAVACTFIPVDGDGEGLHINHKNGNKTDNRVENLEWTTPRGNARHAVDILGRNVGSGNWNCHPVIMADKKTHKRIMSFDTMMEAARWLIDNGIAKSGKEVSVRNCIAKVLHGRSKTYCGYFWELDEARKEEIAVLKETEKRQDAIRETSRLEAYRKQREAEKASKEHEPKRRKSPNSGERRQRKEKFCPDCGKRIDRRSRRCLACHRKHVSEQSAFARTSPESVLERVLRNGYCAVAGEFGVTGNSVRKYLASNGIEPPRRKRKQTHEDIDDNAAGVSSPAVGIQMLSLDGVLISEFPSIKAAARYLRERGCQAAPTHISEASRGLRKTAYGYIWKRIGKGEDSA